MKNVSNGQVFTKKKILGYVSTKIREKGGKRKATIFAAIFLAGIYALIFATEDTMRNTYGRSIVHVKIIIFFGLATLTACGIKDYLNFHKKD
jgi:hypothetical protein